ncbi:MAG: class I SAM-dependent methyltransferase [Gammaproteobacteria bacterium]|nr:class I SAM-dependent methyltransferase [Gammaproteobacteria bacterium]
MQPKSEQVRQFYDAAAGMMHELSFLNYGFAASEAQPDGEGSSERYCLALYAHLLGDAQLAGRDVLEVSCGRGGGAAFVMGRYRPGSLVGIDLSEGNIDAARRREAGVHNLRFRVGNAQALPFADGSFDAVVNVEAAHLYDDPARFLAEVARVLRPEGTFFYTDLFWSSSDPLAMLLAAGLKVTHSEDITAAVLRALELDCPRREQLIATHVPEPLRGDFRDWSGVKGHRAYNRFVAREWVYRLFRAAKAPA